MKSLSDVGSWSTDPKYDPEFDSAPQPMSDFIHYLEERGKVSVKMECHNFQRDEKTKLLVGVDSSDKVGFQIRTKGQKGTEADQKDRAKNLFSHLSPTMIDDTSKLKFVFRMKYQQSDNTIVPQRPAVHFAKTYTVKANTLVQLNNL
jgi:hypothetical protein